MQTKTIKGKIGELSKEETISFYNPNVPEQIETAKKNIRNWFEKEGYDVGEIMFSE
ncbi:MAG: hypothetical protein IJM78_07825 [Prevotella sp.]|nr:hypothetical protein [Prevotella sp.]